jgi:hypothetical protein
MHGLPRNAPGPTVAAGIEQVAEALSVIASAASGKRPRGRKAARRRPFTTMASTAARRWRFAQRSGGQQSRCRGRARRRSRDLEIARQPVVLQAVVAQNDIAVGCARSSARAARRGRCRPHRAAAALRDQHRLVAAPALVGSAAPAAVAGASRRSRGSRCRACGPAPLRSDASHSTSGVLPVPPTLMLPTTMTGTGRRSMRSTPARRRARAATRPDRQAQRVEQQVRGVIRSQCLCHPWGRSVGPLWMRRCERRRPGALTDCSEPDRALTSSAWVVKVIRP